MNIARPLHSIDPKCHQLENEIDRLKHRVDDLKRCYGNEGHHMVDYFKDVIKSRQDYLNLLQKH
jgi:hypothetical protein